MDSTYSKIQNNFTKTLVSKQEKTRATIFLPYISHVSEAVRRILTPQHIRTCFKPHQTLQQLLVHPKGPIYPSVTQKLGVVYWVPCGSCSMAYVRQTSHTLDHRLKEHKLALTSANSSTSTVAEHAMDHNHNIDWASATVTDSHHQFY